LNPEIDIFESMQELFEHPDLNVKIYILEEIINANISNDDKEEFLLTAINSDSVKLQEKAVSIFFDKIENPGAILVKSIISLMCVTHNIKLVDLIIDNISKFDNRKLISILKDYMTTHLPEFQKNIYFLLVKMDSEESFDLIVKALLDNQDKNSSNFYKDILSKKIKTLSENNLNINIYADKIQKILNQVSNFKIKQFFIRELLLLGEQAVLPFFDYYKNSVNREEIIDSLKPVNSQTLYSIFASKIHENENIDTEYFRMIVEIFSKINPEKIFDLISDNSLIGDNEEILVETLKNTRDFSLIVKMLSSGKKTLVLTGLKICEKFDNPSIHETIKKLLKNPDENVRLNAIKSLSRNSLSEMMPIYKEMLSDPSESVQNEILGILSKFNDDNVNKMLVEELNNNHLRDKIIKILGEKNLDYYIKNFSILNDEARLNMAKTLYKTSDKIIRESIKLTKMPEVEKRYMGVKTMSYILPEKQELILPAFKELLNDPDSFIRSTIATSLKDINTPMALIILLTLLKDPNKRVRANCIESFMNTSNVEAVKKALQVFLNDPNNRIRGNAVVVLYKIGDTSAVKHIDNMMNSSDKWMKVTGIYTIGELELEKYAYQLIPYLSDNDKDLRKNSLKALIRIDNSKFKTYIKRLTNDMDPEIRQIANDYFKK